MGTQTSIHQTSDHGPEGRWGHKSPNEYALRGLSGLLIGPFSEVRSGNMFQEWKQAQSSWHDVDLRQERGYFGSRIEARIFGETPYQVACMSAIIAAVDVELVVEP